MQSLPDGPHIFCHRISENRADETNDPAEQKKREQDAKKRRETFFSALPLLAYDGPECHPFHRWLYDTLDSQLARCDTCIRQYHLQKVRFKAQLEQEYDEGEVAAFLGIINKRDIARIRSGLDQANEILEPLPEAQRTPKVLGNAQLFSLFETLHCDVFYNDDELLRKHFDKPFKYVQTHKDLKINEILPAVTKFLFATEKGRLNWAVKTWQRLNRNPTDEEWDWAIRGIMSSELNAIANENGLVRFWSGLKLILDKLSPEQISLKLFDLGFNFARLSLDHLAKNTVAVPQIAQSLAIIFKKASNAYWQALPSVSAATVAEQFFASPNFNKCLEQQVSSGSTNANLDVLSWMDSFLDGLQPASRPAAARTLAHQLLNRVKSDKLTSEARQLCFESAVKQIVNALLTFSEHEKNRKSAARPVISDLLNMVAHFMPTILSFQTDGMSEDQKAAIQSEVLCLVRNSLALECLIFKDDFEALSAGKPNTQSSSYTPDLWRAVKDNLNANDHALTENMLVGAMQLAGLEQFPIKQETPFKAEKESFNAMFYKLETLLTQCVERLAEFGVDHLDPLFSKQNTNMALMAMLFSGNEDMYQATVELVKNIAQEPERKEALSHILEAFLSNTLYSICWVFRRISQKGCFSPIPRLLKTGKDIMDILLDSTGLLRSRKFKDREAEAVQSYWSYSWQMLTVVFQKMERWSIEISDKPLMTEVCRNTMQYAQQLFGHYYLFVNILEQGKNNEDAAQIPGILLNTDAQSSSGSPPKALDAMVKWLRLKDAYLAETLANLIINMLSRLKEYGTTLTADSYALAFVEEVAAGTKGRGTRTILNENQKAGLIRALEQYTGRQIVKQPKIKKQQRLDAWTDPNAKHEPKVKTEVITIDDDDLDEGVKDEDFRELEQAEALRKKALLAEKKEQKPLKKQTIPSRPAPPSLKEQAAKQQANARAFLEQRKKEEAIRKARDREIAARARGGVHTANAGSGLTGLGVLGKDHIVPRSDLMVSSESESDSSDDDELFGSSKPTAILANANRTGKPVAPAPIRKVKQVRSAKDMRARLSPDLTGLHKTILAWDFFADTDTPPNSTRDDYTLVTNTFKTVEDYQKTFEPLLILEGWQSFRTAREENLKSFEVKIASSMIVDNFFEVNSSISFNEGKELGLGPSDVVLLSKSNRPQENPKEPHCLARVKEITRKRGEMQIVYRVNSANNPMRHHLNDKATITATQILSLTPLEREYGALMALPFYDLAEEIIRAKPSPLLEYSDDEVKDIRQLHNLNIAQAKAVKSAVDNDAFTLVQGPPGSGKTKTITAILSEIMIGMNKSKPSTNRPDIPPSSKKVLVAAPSNAAVDELVMRFKDGIQVPGGTTQKINVVRLGRSEAINAGVKDVTLEELVNARLAETSKMDGNGNNKENIQDIMMAHKKVSDEMFEHRSKMDKMRQQNQPVPAQDEQILEAMRRRKTALSSKIDEMKDKQNSASRDADINRRRIQQEILDSAHVLCATLSGSGHEIFQGLNVEFETVIIDEAAQSIELSALIPLKYGCSKCILVGDPKQLPPTVLSRQAAKYQYEQSLFARMEGNHRKDVHLLDVQYRMHPEISAFPSRTFYDSRLRDGGDMAKLRARPWHRSQVFAPYRFFDVEGMSKSAPKGRSLINEAEIDIALAMYERLTSDAPKYDFRGKIGIITPYKGQLTRLKQTFSMRYGDSILSAIEFNTTDAFQGRESEIIIFSCVRASTTGIGFLNDVRRMNVGLTRAKCSLWVLGNSQALVQGEFWRALVTDAKDRNLYTDGDLSKIFQRPLLTPDMMKDDVEMGGTEEAGLEVFQDISSASVTNSKREEAATPASNYGSRATSSRPQSGPSSKQSTPQADPPSRQSSVMSGSRTGGVTPSSKATDSRGKSGSVDRGEANGIKSLGSGRNDSAPAAGEGVVRKSDQQGVGPHGPSGGQNGLNAKVGCAICGSNQHFTRKCDNAKAREAQVGKCQRCGEAGHNQAWCQASRCLKCGVVGHEENGCSAPPNQILNAAQRREVERQESEHERLVEKRVARLREKQVGEHGGKIPEVKSSGEGKRKRETGVDESRKEIKTSKIAEDKAGVSIPSAPSGPAATRPRPAGIGGGATARPTGQAPLIKKKKANESSMFARKR